MNNFSADNKIDLKKLIIIDKLVQKNLKGGNGCPPPIGVPTRPPGGQS